MCLTYNNYVRTIRAYCSFHTPQPNCDIAHGNNMKHTHTHTHTHAHTLTHPHLCIDITLTTIKTLSDFFFKSKNKSLKKQNTIPRKYSQFNKDCCCFYTALVSALQQSHCTLVPWDCGVTITSVCFCCYFVFSGVGGWGGVGWGGGRLCLWGSTHKINTHN